MGSTAHFTPALFEFLAELSMNNNREWFQANKARYERDVRNPLLDFVADFGERLRTISPHMVATRGRRADRCSGYTGTCGSRRTRARTRPTRAPTSATRLGGRSTGRGSTCTCSRGSSFGGAGIWMPNSATLGKIRGAIVENPGRWERIVGDEAFKSRFNLEGGSLKRAPKGIDPDHPLIDYLKLKSFAAGTSFDEDDVVSPGFIDIYTDACRTAAPFSEFLTRAVGLDW